MRPGGAVCLATAIQRPRELSRRTRRWPAYTSRGGESASWWVVLFIFVVVFALYEGVRYLQRRSR